MNAFRIKSRFLEMRQQRLIGKVEACLLAEIEKAEQGSAAGHRFHLARYLHTFSLLPDGRGTLLDLGGACGVFEAVLRKFTNYKLQSADHLAAQPFDFEKDHFPFEDDSFDVVLLMEVLEHFTQDPMHAMSEINRVVKPGGYLLLSTPNITSWKAIRRALNHQHPELFPPYMRHGGSDRHNREYTFYEIGTLVSDAGFAVEYHEAVDVYEHLPTAEPVAGFDTRGRGDTTFCLCKKTGVVRERMPNWLYWP